MREHVIKELISAYIDGEVSDEERAAVQHALESSTELRQFYEQLQSQRAMLGQLPRYTLPGDFSTRVLEEMAARQTTPVVPRSRGARPSFAAVSWAVVAAAALLLITVFLSRLTNTGTGPEGPLAESESRPSGTELVEGPASELPPDQIAAADSLDESFVYYVPTSERRPKYSLLVDVALPPAAQRASAFEDVLRKAGVEFDPALRIDDNLEQAVLESRFAENLQVVDDGESGDEIELTYVVCDMLQFDEIYRRMLNRRGDFPWVQLDLIINPEELDILFQLNDQSRRRFAQQLDSPTRRTLAHRLVFNVSLRSSSLSFLGKIPTPSLTAELVPEEEAAGRLKLPFFVAPRPAGARAEPKRPAETEEQSVARGAERGQNLRAESEELQKSEIIFLLRKLSEDVEK